MVADPVIISVAITGSVPRKSDNPALPVTPSEQIESTHEAFEAGATLVHIQRLLEILVEEGRRVFPNGTWTAAGIGRHQNEVCGWALALGGHIRTGLEDNIRQSKDRLADSNAALVRDAVAAITSRGRRPATPAEARGLLRL